MANLNVLVADYEDATRGLLHNILTAHGHTVTCAENGAQALVALSNSMADVVYLNVRFPHGDGLAALKSIRRLWPSLPVIIITGSGQRELVDEAMGLVVHACLTQPFRNQDAIDILEILKPNSRS
jgi:DNA-binding NtrC family response regulator